MEKKINVLETLKSIVEHIEYDIKCIEGGDDTWIETENNVPKAILNIAEYYSADIEYIN